MAAHVDLLGNCRCVLQVECAAALQAETMVQDDCEAACASHQVG